MSSHLETSLQTLLQQIWPSKNQLIAVFPGFCTVDASPEQLRRMAADFSALRHAKQCASLQFHLHAPALPEALTHLPFYAIAQSDGQSANEFEFFTDRLAAHFQLPAALVLDQAQPEHSSTISYDHVQQVQTQQHSAHALDAFFQQLIRPLPVETAAVEANLTILIPEPQTNFGRLARLQCGKDILNALNA